MNNLFWPDQSTSYLYFSQVSLSTPNLLEVLLSRRLDDDCGTSWECLLYLDILIWNTVCQHYCSILMSLLDRRVLTLFVTESLASNVEKYSFNLHISTHLYTVICFLKFILKRKSYWIEIFLVGILSRLDCVNFRASTKWHYCLQSKNKIITSRTYVSTPHFEFSLPNNFLLNSIS